MVHLSRAGSKMEFSVSSCTFKRVCAEKWEGIGRRIGEFCFTRAPNLQTCCEYYADACTGEWTPEGFARACGPDGDFSGQQSGTPFIASAPLGALIARIGGSTADATLDPTSTTRIAFSVGRRCIFVTPTTVRGALFLGVNDSAPNMLKLAGRLCVDVYEAM
jgi:hypothetical protein